MVVNDIRILDQLYIENPRLTTYDELDLTNQQVLDELAKIKSINVSFNDKDNMGTIQDTLGQLRAIIKKCPNLEYLRVYSLCADSINISVDELLDQLIQQDVNRVIVYGFHYDYSSLFHKILSAQNKTTIRLDRIDDEKNGFAYVFGPEELRKKVQFSSYGSEELNQLFDELRFGYISIGNYEKYRDYLDSYKDLYVSIGNVSELNLEQLERIKSDSRIQGIQIRCGYRDLINKTNYSVEEYERIRKVVDHIISMIKVPEEDNPDRDKILFAQLYKILGKNIRYDHYAISDEGKMNETLRLDCRNLKNGLLGTIRNGKKELLSVCAGYATILQNICACFGIRCDYLRSSSREIEQPGSTQFGGVKQYENGTTDPMGHAYNAVYLDGKAYLCDLTWDANCMMLDNIGAHFLVSYDEFCKSHKDEGFSYNTVTVITQDGKNSYSIDPSLFVHSCSLEEQQQLFGIIAKENIEEMIREGYLADFAMKNVEYIKQVKGKMGMIEYLRLIRVIHMLEDYIISPNFETDAGWTYKCVNFEIADEDGNVTAIKNCVFYPGTAVLSVSDAVLKVKEMEEKQWKIR